MDETKYSGAFQIIMNAGNSKSAALMAIDCLLYTSSSSAAAAQISRRLDMYFSFTLMNTAFYTRWA